MRNSSLVEWFCAENVTGLKFSAEAAGFCFIAGAVGERRADSEAAAEASRGDCTSANAGMSSERRVRISSADCPRVPGEGSSAQGKSGPKARPRGVVDG